MKSEYYEVDLNIGERVKTDGNCERSMRLALVDGEWGEEDVLVEEREDKGEEDVTEGDRE